ncbi:MAG TPA: hypothetical protein VGY53_11400, partial [Isosphaeraceae bacterium]|nr:hypothetical protein [Isosphaeraceae bacterium]
RRWHTRDRVAKNGQPARWDGQILEQVVNRIQELAPSVKTDWSQRTMVTIAAGKSGTPSFFQALTTHEWIITLKFFLPHNAFKPEVLDRQLRLTPFHEGPNPVLSDSRRLVVTKSRGKGQEVVITCHAAADLETEGFQSFLASAVRTYQQSFGTKQEKTKGSNSWAADGATIQKRLKLLPKRKGRGVKSGE